MSSFAQYEMIVGSECVETGGDTKLFKVNQTIQLPKELSKQERALSRDVRLASSVFTKLYSKVQINHYAPSRIGLYGAFSNGPLLYEHAKLFENYNNPSSFRQILMNWPPRQHLKQTAPIKLSVLSLIYKFCGPMFCFTDPFNSFESAITAAKADLDSDATDAAFILSSFSFDEDQLVDLYRSPTTPHLYECAISVFLEKNTNTAALIKQTNQFSFGPISSFSSIKEI